jgi:hypothetical protein
MSALPNYIYIKSIHTNTPNHLLHITQQSDNQQEQLACSNLKTLSPSKFQSCIYHTSNSLTETAHQKFILLRLLVLCQFHLQQMQQLPNYKIYQIQLHRRFQ